MASADFFAMFEVPFLQGSGWDAAADEGQARVAVISKKLDEQLFAGSNAVGRDIVLRGEHFRVIGVLDTWRPVPHYFDMTNGAYREAEDVYLPISTGIALKLSSSGNTTCWGSTGADGPHGLNAPCAWLQYWVELASPGDAPAFRDYLTHYSEEQHRAGRFERPANIRLRNVTDWLVHQQVLPGDVALQLWLAFGFLLVCLVNTVGLLLAKCLRRGADIGVRRALGATRRAIFAQFLVEAGAIGLAGGVLGLLLAGLGLWLVRQSPAEYAPLAQLDAPMLLLTFALSLAASLLAGLLPAWHATRIVPAQHLKTL
jgi:putative ABC transport system permease protein